MDAVKYFEEKKRMCSSYRGSCVECELSCKRDGGSRVICNEFERIFPGKAVEIVEEWSKENPKITNRKKFIEVFGIIPCVSCDWWDKEYKEPEESK